jgi:hypothetical protein
MRRPALPVAEHPTREAELGGAPHRRDLRDRAKSMVLRPSSGLRSGPCAAQLLGQEAAPFLKEKNSTLRSSM